MMKTEKMKTYWLIVTMTTSPKIIPSLVKRVDGTRGEVTDARNKYAEELGDDYIVTAETDKEARLYTSYRQFPRSNEETY